MNTNKYGITGRIAVLALLACVGAAGLAAPASAARALARTPAARALAAHGAAARTPAARGTAARGAAAPAGPASPPAILLINGDRVTMTTTGSGLHVAAVARASAGGLNGALIKLNLGGTALAIPLDGLPYLNRGLSPALFELSSLRRLESGGRLPVRIGYRGRLHALPGVTITRSGGGIARGYLTAGSARVFGAALARQMAADHARGSYGTDGLFAGGVTIGLPGTPVAAPARPDFPMHTLTVTGTNLAGQPDTGDIVNVLSVDSLLRFGDPNETFSVFDNGTAKFSVPAGHYMAIALFTDFSASGPAASRLVTLPQFTVAGNTTITADERTATSEVQMATPRPVLIQDISLDIHRVAANGDTVDDMLDAGTLPLWTNTTTQPVTVGMLRTITTGYLTSPPGAGRPYEYDLTFAGRAGLIGPQQFVVSPASVATVHARYFQDAASTGGWAPLGIFRFQIAPIFITFTDIFPFRLPRSLTQYTSAGPSLIWLDQYWQSGAALAGGQTDAPRTFTPGGATAEDWNAYPLHPTPGVNLLGRGNPLPAVPSASRAGNHLLLVAAPFGDNTPGHAGSGFSAGVGPDGTSGRITGGFELDQNGKKIAGGNAVTASGGGTFLTVAAGLSPRPATIRFVLDATRTGPLFRLSTGSRTVWTWRSARQPGARVTAGWICPDGTRLCAVQPMMTLLYAVRGLAVNGSAPAGPQRILVTVGHLQLAKAARITGVTAQVSFTGGRTWRRARVTQADGGRFAVRFASPAPGAPVSLRLHAADAAGGQITETVIRAYRIGPAAPAPAVAAATLAAAAGSAPRRAPSPGPGFGPVRAACAPVPAGYARCLALFAPEEAVNGAIDRGVRGAAAQPKGLSARNIESAYKLPVARGSRETVAVVDAFRTPALAANLAVYRRQNGLPPCLESTGCLRVVNQNGKASPLPVSGVPTGWDVETMLDVSMVSAACPHCKILVVEARDDSFANLAAAENAAARLGAQVISNSYGARETGFTQAEAAAYDHPGHTIVVSSGDIGFTAAQFPANLASVTAVGGTILSRARNARGWSERVWLNQFGASGSGCSAYVAKPAWQHDANCGMRTVADVAAVAWNVAIYEKIQGGWLTVGGTSASAPVIAGVYALAGNAATIAPGHEYAHARSLFDVTTGNNDLFAGAGGATCGFDYLCTAKRGYDAPTGLGTPDGTGAF